MLTFITIDRETCLLLTVLYEFVSVWDFGGSAVVAR